MFLVPLVGLVDKPFVELRFAHARFVRGDEQDCVALRIEGEGDPPDAPIRLEAKLLHVCVLRSIQRVYLGPSQGWTELPKWREGGGQSVLYRI